MRFISVPCPQCEAPVDTVEGRESAACPSCGALFRTGIDRETLYLRGLDARMGAEEGRGAMQGAPAHGARADAREALEASEGGAGREGSGARGERLRIVKVLLLLGLLMALIGGGGGLLLGRANVILDNLAALGLLAILIAGLVWFRGTGRD